MYNYEYQSIWWDHIHSHPVEPSVGGIGRASHGNIIWSAGSTKGSSTATIEILACQWLSMSSTNWCSHGSGTTATKPAFVLFEEVSSAKHLWMVYEWQVSSRIIRGDWQPCGYVTEAIPTIASPLSAPVVLWFWSLRAMPSHPSGWAWAHLTNASRL